MAAVLENYSVKTLVALLRHLRAGKIGFDPYRDPRTAKKQQLVEYIMQQFAPPEIHYALAHLGLGVPETPTTKPETPTTKTEEKPPMFTVRLHTKDVNEALNITEFNSQSSYEEAEGNARAWLMEFPMYRSVFPGLIRVNTPPGSSYAQHWMGVAQSLSTISQEEPKVPPKPIAAEPIPAKQSTNQTADQLSALLLQLSKGALDQEAINKLIDARHSAHIDNLLAAVNKRLDELHVPTVVQVQQVDIKKPPKNLKTQHKKFPQLFKMVQARTHQGNRLNIWLKGSPGTGKTTAARAVAEALDLKFYFNGALTTEYDLLGFKDANGNYHSTSFRNAYEQGGVYLFDEVDASLPRAVLAFNAALDNGVCTFPDKPVDRHTDFICLAGANTSGSGATSSMTGRVKQDEASRDRFVYLDWELDPALERALSQDSEWLKAVYNARAVVEERKAQHFITPRAVIYGDALIKAGVTLSQAVDSCLVKGCEPTLGAAIRKAALDEQHTSISV